MALVTSKINGSEFSCLLTITDSGHFNTPELIVGEVPWRINFRKVVNRKNDERLLYAWLSCEYQCENVNWWIEAEANLKLLPLNGEEEPIEMKFQKNKFMESSRMSEWKFIHLEDFLGQENGYVKDNGFSIECAIVMSPMIKEPCLPSSHVAIRTRQQFIMKVEKVDVLKSVTSPKYNLRGADWYVKLTKYGGKLSVHLYKDKSDQELTLSVDVNFSVKLLSFSQESNPIILKFNRTFMSEDTSGWGWGEFVDWDTFIDKDKQYVKNNAAFFDIAIKIGPWKLMWERENVLKENQSGCPICLDPFVNKNVVATKCGHLFCAGCIKSSIDRASKCPVCKKIISENDLRKIFLNQ